MAAALAPEELESVIPEQKPNLPQVLADLDHLKIAQTNHRNNLFDAVRDIWETRVKVFRTRAEPLYFKASSTEFHNS